MIIDIEPVGKPRMTQRDKWSHRPVVVKYFAFADDLRNKYKQELPKEPSLIFFITMPKSWSKKKKAEKLHTPHDQKPDIDNLIKSVLDIKCKEDKHIAKVLAEKYWSLKGAIDITSIDRE